MKLVRKACLVAFACLGGCAAPVVEMSLQLPSDGNGGQFDMSCVTAVEVYTDGNHYPIDLNDTKRDCIELTAPAATFKDIRVRVEETKP